MSSVAWVPHGKDKWVSQPEEQLHHKCLEQHMDQKECHDRSCDSDAPGCGPCLPVPEAHGQACAAGQGVVPPSSMACRARLGIAAHLLGHSAAASVCQDIRV